MLIATGQNNKYLIDASGICKYPSNADVNDGLISEALPLGVAE